MIFITKSSITVGLMAALLPALLGSCASPQRSGSGASSTQTDTSMPAAPAHAPADTKAGYELRSFEEKTLPNGLRVLFIPDQALPYVSYSLMIRAGSAQDPEGLSGLSSFVAETIDKGTSKRPAPVIAQALGQMGADFDASSSIDHSIVSGSALSTQAEELLKNMVEIVTQPAFSDAEIERRRKQVVASIERRVDSADSFAGLAFADYLYGSHPYGRPVIGNAAGAKAIKKKNIIQFYLRYYRPNNSMLAVVGKFTPELAQKVEQAFGAWQKRDVPEVKLPDVAPVQGLNIRLVDKPGLVQAQIRIGKLGIARKNEDFLTLRVANTVLGGAFASRLMKRVRDQLGLTYTISSSFDPRLAPGPFEISTFTKNQSVGQTISETLKVLSEYRTNGPSREELDAIKGYLKGIFPSAIETPERLAYNLMVLRFYGIPDSYLTNYLKDVDRVSIADVRSAINKYFDDKNLKVVVYSSASEVRAQLEPLGKLEIIKATDLQ